MFARGVFSLHTTHLPVQKTLACKPRVSITSKLIQIKGLQLQYFHHLRKTGGMGSYRLVHTTHHLVRKRAGGPATSLPETFFAPLLKTRFQIQPEELHPAAQGISPPACSDESAYTHRRKT